MCNFSANHLFLKWNPPGGNTTLNHYRVVINGYQQQTFGSIPEIYWNKKLTPGTMYKVTIVAVSYGDLFSGPWYGSAESKPFVDWIETETGTYMYISNKLMEENMFKASICFKLKSVYFCKSVCKPIFYFIFYSRRLIYNFDQFIYNHIIQTWILGNEEAYSYLPFGERDEVLRGDDVTSAILRSPITVYAGDNSQGGFNFVRVSFYFEKVERHEELKT